MKRSLLFCVGNSGGGKTTFINNLPEGLYYNLRSYTTRKKRVDDVDGVKYFFVDETEFNSQKFVTKLWVNEDIWSPDKPKWLYGVPEFEVYDNLGKNFVYDVIEPRYARQMMDWFQTRKLDTDYDIKLVWFVPPMGNDIVIKRANMPDDKKVRDKNTCSIHDIFDAGFADGPDFILRPRCGNKNSHLLQYIGAIYEDWMRMQEKAKNTHGR